VKDLPSLENPEQTPLYFAIGQEIVSLVAEQEGQNLVLKFIYNDPRKEVIVPLTALHKAEQTPLLKQHEDFYKSLLEGYEPQCKIS
jgi:hypothetical protein